MISVNLLERPGRVWSGSRAEKVWTDADEARFLEVASPQMGLALTLGLWTGQRQGGLLRLTWKAYDGQFIRLRQSKSGVHVTVPVGAPLKAILDDTSHRSPFIITSDDDRPYTSDGFRASWRKTCDRAGVKGLTFHDLRGTYFTSGPRWCDRNGDCSHHRSRRKRRQIDHGQILFASRSEDGPQCAEARKGNKVCKPVCKPARMTLSRKTRQRRNVSDFNCFDGGRTRARTLDPLIKSQLLYQLSYAPIATAGLIPLGKGRRLAKASRAVQRKPGAGDRPPARPALHRKAGSVLGLVDQFVLADPGHHGA